MRLGLLADIHEAIEPLTLALARFRELGVDCILTLGDAYDSFTPHSREAHSGRD